MEITQSYGQESLINDFLFDFSKLKKTRKEINHANYLKHQEERKIKNHTYYLENSKQINEKKREKYKSEKKSLKVDFLYRRTRNNIKEKQKCLKDSICFCYSDRKDRKKLLFCSLNSSDKRLGALNKNPSVNGLGWNEPTYKEKNNWNQLLQSNKFNQIGIRGGKRLGLGYDYWDDSDLLNKPEYDKNSNHYKEKWRERRLLSNFDRGIKKVKVIYAETRHGRRINVNACCEWPTINFFHIDPWKKRKVVIGDCRGKGKFTVIDGKDYNWKTETGKLSWRFRCKQEQPKEGQEVGEVKTCLQQYIEAKKLLFFVDCVISDKKPQILAKPKEKSTKINKVGLFITTSKILAKKQLIHKATGEYKPWQINYLNENNQERYFILNTYQKGQEQLLNLFAENSTHNLQLYQGNYQVFFNSLCH